MQNPCNIEVTVSYITFDKNSLKMTKNHENNMIFLQNDGTSILQGFCNSAWNMKMTLEICSERPIKKNCTDRLSFKGFSKIVDLVSCRLAIFKPF